MLWCSRCHGHTPHGDLVDHGDGLMGKGPPSRLITARCLTCGFLNNKSGYVVTEANLAAELRGKL